MLYRALQNAGMPDSKLYATHLLLCRPPEGIERCLKDIKIENKRRGVASRKYTKRLETVARKYERALGVYEREIERERVRWNKAFAKAWEKYEKECARILDKNQREALRTAEKILRVSEQNVRIIEANARLVARGKPEKPLKLIPDQFRPHDLPDLPPVPAHKETREPPVREEDPEHPGDTAQINSPVDCCAPRLARELQSRTSVLMVGKHTMHALTAREKILEEQGYPIRLDGLGGHGIIPAKPAETPVWGVPVMHPAGIINNLKMLWMEGPFGVYVAKSVRIHDRGSPNWWEPSALYTAPRVINALKDLLAEADHRMFFAREEGPIAVACDVETDGYSVVYAKLRCIGFSWGSQIAIVPVHSVDGRYIGIADVIERARQVLAHPFIRIVFHNGTFDRGVLESYYDQSYGPPPDGLFHVDGCGGDTLLMHHIIESELRHSLAFVTGLLLECPSWKETGGGGGDHGLSATSDPQLWLYNGRDCWRTQRVHEEMLPYLAQDELTAVYTNAIEVQPWLADIQRNGLFVHQDKVGAIVARLAEEENRCHWEMAMALREARETFPQRAQVFDITLCGDVFNHDRPLHREAAMVLLDIDTPRTKSGYRTTAADDLVRAIPDLAPYARTFIGTKLDEHVEARGFLGAKMTSKYVSTFCTMDGIDEDGRQRTSWKQHGAVTGRFSAGDKKVVSTDKSYQNIPAWLRAMYGAEPGNLLVASDYSALELWIIAIFTGAKALLAALQSDDVHRYNTEGLFGLKFGDKMTLAAATGCGAKHGFTDIPRVCGTVSIDRAHFVVHDTGGKKIKVEWPGVQCKACRAAAERATTVMQDRLIDLRVQGKRFVYAANYQGSATSIWLKLQTSFPGLQLQDVEALKTAWETMNPEINAKAQENYQRFHHRFLRQGIGYLASPILGRRRYWTGKEFKITDASNYPIQAGGADVVNLALPRVGPRIKKLGGKLIFQVHDSIGAECPEAVAEDVKAVLEEEMPGRYTFMEGMPGEWSFPVEADIGTYWNEV